MSIRAEQKLQTFNELRLQPKGVPKACAVGVVVDATSAYFDQTKKRLVKKIKLVDDTLNSGKFDPFQKIHYVNVFFYGPKEESLPNPRAIGDILYLRRFSFGKYNEGLQGHFIEAKYCSWALLRGDTASSEPEEYQSSRAEIDLHDEKFENLLERVGELRKFAREYLTKTSILSILPAGVTTKDSDLIVRVIKKSEGGFLLENSKHEIILNDITSFAKEGDFAKLRSVVRLDYESNPAAIVPNAFTSLVALPEWSNDSQLFIRNKKGDMDVEEDNIYTFLAQLNSLPLNECENKKYFVKVEVAAVSAVEFTSALFYFDEQKRTLSESPKKGTVPIYKFNFVAFDESLVKSHKFSEIWLFSYDGLGGDFVERVDLSDLGELSNYSEESEYFKKRLEGVLNSEFVKMTVEVVSDGKGGRILRALSVS